MAIAFYIEYQNRRVTLPVNPEKLTVTRDSSAETEMVINLGEVSIPQLPDLRSLSFESFIPVKNFGTFVVPGVRVYEPKFYKDFFEAIQNESAPIKLSISGMDFSQTMAIEGFEYTYEGADEDMYFSLDFIEYRAYGPRNVATTKVARTNITKQLGSGSIVELKGKVYKASNSDVVTRTVNGLIGVVKLYRKTRRHPLYIVDGRGDRVGWINLDTVKSVKTR